MIESLNYICSYYNVEGNYFDFFYKKPMLLLKCIDIELLQRRKQRNLKLYFNIDIPTHE